MLGGPKNNKLSQRPSNISFRHYVVFEKLSRPHVSGYGTPF